MKLNVSEGFCIRIGICEKFLNRKSLIYMHRGLLCIKWLCIQIALLHFLNSPWSQYFRILLLQMIVMCFSMATHGWTKLHIHANHDRSGV